MNSKIQVLSFAISFLYGIFFFLLTKFNKYIVGGKKIFFQFIVTLIFIIDIVILYIYIMYKINFGIIHPYFLMILLLGYYLTAISFNKIKKLCKICVKKVKVLK